MSKLSGMLKRASASVSRSIPAAPSAAWSAALLIGGVAVVGTWFASPRALLIQEVRFEGTVRASAAELRHLVDIPNGTTQLGVAEETVARAAERHPWVRSAGMRRTWHGVVVMVDEHRPVALAQIGGELVYLDERGEPFLAARSDDLDYPVIAGLDDALMSLHPDLAGRVLAMAIDLLDQADTRGLIALDDVSEVVFAPTSGFTIHTRAGARVLFGLDDHAEQLDRLSRLMARGVDVMAPTYVDLGPERVAIVRDITPPGEG